MNSTCLLGLMVALSFAGRATAGLDLREGCAVQFASAHQGADILGRKDDFIERLSAFDRAARVKTDRSVSEQEFLKFVKKSVLTWNESEKARIEAAIAKIQPALEALPLSLPKIIYLVKTSGEEEGKAFYTRDTAIVFPESQIRDPDAEFLQKIIAHELFHIWSRKNPVLREKLYALIGFTKCPEIDVPADLKQRKITNPDAPRNDHSIHLQVDGREVAGIPILFSASEKYDTKRGGEFFEYLQFKFLLTPANQLADPEKVSGFLEQVGRNTSYVIHPEEILAENFVLLILDQHDVASPEILLRMRQVLESK
ncbi:MAG: hypothetical protein ABI925_08400 [Verrucomicrobiota bacterium]